MISVIETTLSALIAESQQRNSTEVFRDEHFKRQFLSFLNGERDAATQIVGLLSERGTFEQCESSTGALAVWEVLTKIYCDHCRFYETLTLAFGLYRWVLSTEEKRGQRLHKGMPLVFIADAYKGLGYVAHEERYLMLTLCEDAIRGKGDIDPNTTGIYFRLVWGLGFSHDQVNEYARAFYKAYQMNPSHGFYPEGLLQDIDTQRRWQLRPPAPAEMSVYVSNSAYIRFLLSQLGDGTGKTLERLAEYLLSCMAGCRARGRRESLVTEYDVVCSMNGNYIDFRSEFGRYFVCECKDWKSRAGISVIAKFCRILDSTKARFGILFSSAGITGMDDAAFAAREQQKIFQDRGLVIIVIDETDLEAVARGENFINILRNKYEDVRLDLKRSSDPAETL